MAEEDDWLMRQIRQIADVVARLFALRDANELAEARVQADQASRKLIGLDIDVVTRMPLHGLIALFGTAPDRQRLRSLARLVEVDASIHENDRIPRQIRALDLYAESGDPGEEGLALADALVDVSAARHACFRVHRNGRRWSDAEDDLFAMLDDGHPDAAEEGVAFYGWLLAQKDEVLLAGDLPRDEVEQGLADLLQHLA